MQINVLFKYNQVIASPPLRSRAPLNQLGDLGSAVSSPSRVRVRVMAENEFGVLWSCQKAFGRNDFEYSEVHVLYYVE